MLTNIEIETMTLIKSACKAICNHFDVKAKKKCVAVIPYETLTDFCKENVWEVISANISEGKVCIVYTTKPHD